MLLPHELLVRFGAAIAVLVLLPLGPATLSAQFGGVAADLTLSAPATPRGPRALPSGITFRLPPSRPPGDDVRTPEDVLAHEDPLRDPGPRDRRKGARRGAVIGAVVGGLLGAVAFHEVLHKTDDGVAEACPPDGCRAVASGPNVARAFLPIAYLIAIATGAVPGAIVGAGVGAVVGASRFSQAPASMK